MKERGEEEASKMKIKAKDHLSESSRGLPSTTPSATRLAKKQNIHVKKRAITTEKGIFKHDKNCYKCIFQAIGI